MGRPVPGRPGRARHHAHPPRLRRAGAHRTAVRHRPPGRLRARRDPGARPGGTLIVLPLVPGSPATAFSEAGSSMFTLGYAAPSGTNSTVAAYLAAFTGLVVVGLQIGYLPTLYSAFNRRETAVTLLISRAGIPAWGPEILARTQWGIYGADTRTYLGELFEAWEGWAAE